MNMNLEPIKNWFGFTRRERRSAGILLLIIVIVISIRYFIPLKNTEIEEITGMVSDSENKYEAQSTEKSAEGKLFSFDPNNASYDTLIKLGLAEKEASTLISYRKRGGKFRQPTDLKKIYGIEDSSAEKLIPFVEVKKERSEKVSYGSFSKAVPLDLNNCDSAALVRLPGIGPVLSSRIIKYRHLLGGFVRIDQLKEIYGLPVETFDLIKGKVYADSSVIFRIKINSTGYREISRIPYLEKYEVSAIMKYRELKGNLSGISDMVDHKLITQEKAEKLRLYVSFE